MCFKCILNIGGTTQLEVYPKIQPLSKEATHFDLWPWVWVDLPHLRLPLKLWKIFYSRAWPEQSLAVAAVGWLHGGRGNCGREGREEGRKEGRPSLSLSLALLPPPSRAFFCPSTVYVHWVCLIRDIAKAGLQFYVSDALWLTKQTWDVNDTIYLKPYV